MAIIFVCHPFRRDPAGNQTLIAHIARELALEGHVPLAPQIFLPAFIDEARERSLALSLCLKLVALADAVWVYGDPTDGMRSEIVEAQRLGIPVVQKELP